MLIRKFLVGVDLNHAENTKAKDARSYRNHQGSPSHGIIAYSTSNSAERGRLSCFEASAGRRGAALLDQSEIRFKIAVYIRCASAIASAGDIRLIIQSIL